MRLKVNAKQVARRTAAGAAGSGTAAAAALVARRLVRRRRARLASPSPLVRTATPRSPVGVMASTRLVGPVTESPLVSTLAAWNPDPPGTPAGRVLARVWAAPMTLAGLLVGLGSGVAPKLRDGVVVFERAGGPTGAVLRSRGFTASALGHVVVSRTDLHGDLLVHELAHVRQAERLGPFMAPVYLALLARFGYARHPLERAARAAALGSGSTGRTKTQTETAPRSPD